MERTPLQPDFELLVGGDALFVDGIGEIAQYHNWSDMFYSHGFIYYLRDSLLRDVQRDAERGVPLTSLRSRITRLNTLNSKIEAWEEAWSNPS